MAITVDLIRNVLTSKYLTHAGNTIAFHNIKNHPGKTLVQTRQYNDNSLLNLDNFHLYADGLVRNLQVFSNSNLKITHVPAAGDCNQGLTTSSTGSIIHVTPNSSLGVKLYVEDSNGHKHYLRINTVQNNTVELVCQSYVDSVSWNILVKSINPIYFIYLTTNSDS